MNPLVLGDFLGALITGKLKSTQKCLLNTNEFRDPKSHSGGSP
jgi:hypothetical protein